MSISPPSSPNLRASLFAPSYVSPLSLGGEDLIDVLQNLCESAKEAPCYKEFPINGKTLYLYAITKESGGITLETAHGPASYEHQLLDGCATILGWSESSEAFYALEDGYSWAASDFIWLGSAPSSSRGIIKEIVTL